MTLSDMKGTLKLTAAGQVTLTPDAYVVNALSTDTKCAPTEAVQPAATITVTAGEGSSGSGSGSASPSTSSDPSQSQSPSPSSSASGTPSTSPSASATGGGGQTDFTGKVVDIPYTCQSPIGEKKATSPIQINAKKNGGSYDIPAGKVKPTMQIVLGGADTGSVTVEGPLNSAPIPQNEPIEIPDLTGVYKPGATGESTLSPGVLLIEAMGTTTTCTPDSTAVSLTLDTSEQASGASGGSGSSSSSSSAGGSTSSSGGLAETGSGDHGTLKALGLVAGTAILLGGAVFTFMPRRRAS
jgi:hypothetical protein